MSRFDPSLASLGAVHDYCFNLIIQRRRLKVLYETSNDGCFWKCNLCSAEFTLPPHRKGGDYKELQAHNLSHAQEFLANAELSPEEEAQMMECVLCTRDYK